MDSMTRESTREEIEKELASDLYWIESNSHDPQAMVSAPEMQRLARTYLSLKARLEAAENRIKELESPK